MPCRLESRGKSLGIVVPDGLTRLSEILSKVVKEKGIDLSKLNGRIEGIVGFEDLDCDFAIEANKGMVVAACVDCGSEILGTEAISKLTELMGRVPLNGYVEVVELAEAAIMFDIELRPKLNVSKPIRLNEVILGKAEKSVPQKRTVSATKTTATTATEARREGIEKKETRKTKQVTRPSTKPAKETEKVAEKVTGGVREITKSYEDLGLSPEVLFANIVMNSKPLDVSIGRLNLKESLKKMLSLSHSKNDVIYRLAVCTKDGTLVNIVAYQGKVRLILRYPASHDIMDVKYTDDEITKELNMLRDDNLKHMILFEIKNDEVINILRRLSSPSRASQEKKQKHQERKGLLSRLFRR